MSEPKPTGLARIPLLLLHQAQGLGIDRARLLEAAGLGERELSDPDARVGFEKIVKLWRAVIEHDSDPALGIRLGASTKLRQWGVVGYAMCNSTSLDGALHRLCRYSRVISEAVAARLEPDTDGARLVVEADPSLDALRQPVDLWLAGLVVSARELTGVEIVPAEVWFPHARPPETREYERLFRAPLRFGRSPAALLLRRRDLERPVVGADETLGGYLDRLADQVLASLGTEDSFGHRVRQAIWSEFSGGKPTLEHIASLLGVSARTLQRRLGDEGTTFAAVLDRLRHRMAIELLGDRSLAVYQIAYLLGYSEASPFQRAFRRWEGVPPLEYRRAHAS